MSLTELERLRGEVVVLRKIAEERLNSLRDELTWGDSCHARIVEQQIAEFEKRLAPTPLSEKAAEVLRLNLKLREAQIAIDTHDETKKSLCSWGDAIQGIAKELEVAVDAYRKAVDALRQAEEGGETDGG